MPRIKIDAKHSDGTYHVVLRILNGEQLLDHEAKQVFCCLMHRASNFCGIRLTTFNVLSNHVHLMPLVPLFEEISNIELLRRFKVLYPEGAFVSPWHRAYSLADLEVGDPMALQWKARQLARMNDLSQWMKILKQRFTIWYNAKHKRIGPLWNERFTSKIVDSMDGSLLATAAYIDLNAVRAGLSAVPGDYPFCGYAAALGGNTALQSELARVVGEPSWGAAQARYRDALYAIGSVPKENAATISIEALRMVLEEKGLVHPASP